jgi:tRNA-N(6)-(isopentenyl)adenosine-37 thiotransferase enzyme MiaB
MENATKKINGDDIKEYCQLVRSVMEARLDGRTPLAFTHTYGCQGNVSDGERINGMLSEMGFDFTDDPDKADFILYNTCAVREHAEDRVFGNVGALKHVKNRNPNLIIALCGCMVQQKSVADKIRASYPHVNLVFGTHVINRFPELLYRTLTGGKRVFELSQEDNSICEELPVRRDSSIRAWLPIMYGCDNFCTYCIVPHVRGRERSRDASKVLAEAKAIIAAGYKEITLLGQNVNSYAVKNAVSSDGEDWNFPKLLREIDSIEGDYILRFMTSHPKDCTPELLDAMAEGKHTAHHLHLPVQCGSNRVLKVMNRRYTREKYLELVRMAREKMPDISLTSDIIVGFPGETYEEFQETLSLVREVKYTSLFTFIYSAREGTPAAKMEDPVPHAEKAKWMKELLETQEKIAAERCASMMGSRQRVLVEGVDSRDDSLFCRTGTNIVVKCMGSPDMVGHFAECEITDAKNWVLQGKFIK